MRKRDIRDSSFARHSERIDILNRYLGLVAPMLLMLFLPLRAGAQIAASLLTNSATSLYDDATLQDPGALSFDVYNSYSRMKNGYALSAPGADFALGLNRRLELSAFSGFAYSKYQPNVRSGLDDTYGGLKVLLLSQGEHAPAIAVKPAIELFSKDYGDYEGPSRTAFVLPFLIQKDFAAWSASYTAGYISQGAAFSTLKLEGDWWEHVTPLAVVSYSQATTDLATLSKLGLNRRQAEASLGISKDMNPRWGVFVDVGQAIGRRDVNSPSIECTAGITINTSLRHPTEGTSHRRFPIHF